jgi:hypothetical protein
MRRDKDLLEKDRQLLQKILKDQTQIKNIIKIFETFSPLLYIHSEAIEILYGEKNERIIIRNINEYGALEVSIEGIPFSRVKGLKEISIKKDYSPEYDLEGLANWRIRKDVMHYLSLEHNFEARSVIIQTDPFENRIKFLYVGNGGSLEVDFKKDYGIILHKDYITSTEIGVRLIDKLKDIFQIVLTDSQLILFEIQEDLSLKCEMEGRSGIKVSFYMDHLIESKYEMDFTSLFYSIYERDFPNGMIKCLQIKEGLIEDRERVEKEISKSIIHREENIEKYNRNEEKIFDKDSSEKSSMTKDELRVYMRKEGIHLPDDKRKKSLLQEIRLEIRERIRNLEREIKEYEGWIEINEEYGEVLEEIKLIEKRNEKGGSSIVEVQNKAYKGDGTVYRINTFSKERALEIKRKLSKYKQKYITLYGGFGFLFKFKCFPIIYLLDVEMDKRDK